MSSTSTSSSTGGAAPRDTCRTWRISSDTPARGGVLRHDPPRERARPRSRPSSRPGWSWSRRRRNRAAGRRGRPDGVVVVGEAAWPPCSAEFRPDVVHLHNVYHQFSPSILLPLPAAACRAVMTLHDYKLACPSYQMLDKGQPCDACVTGGPLQAARRACKDGSRLASTLLAVESWLHRRPGAYGGRRPVVPSRFLAEVGAAGVYPDRLRVLPHLVDVDPSCSRRGRRGLVFAGRLAPRRASTP